MDSKQNRERMESGKLYFPADEAVMAEQLINQCPDRISRIINHRLIPVTYNAADTNLQRGSLSYIKV